jgi:hypothetical protein
MHACMHAFIHILHTTLVTYSSCLIALAHLCSDGRGSSGGSWSGSGNGSGQLVLGCGYRLNSSCHLLAACTCITTRITHCVSYTNHPSSQPPLHAILQHHLWFQTNCTFLTHNITHQTTTSTPCAPRGPNVPYPNPQASFGVWYHMGGTPHVSPQPKVSEL